jgi:hypothetical protein
VFASAISPLCILIMMFEPDLGEFSNEIRNACFFIVIFIGISGFLLAILEKKGIVEISYSAEDKTKLFYKILNIDKYIFK